MLFDIATGLLHVVTGLFFVTTGARKCFIPSVRTKVCGMFDSHGVPKPLQFLVMGGEFVGGLGLLFGCLTQLAALGLLVIMFGAYLMDTWPSVKAKQEWVKRTVWVSLLVDGAVGYSTVRQYPKSWSQLCSNAMCTPEFQLIVVLVVLALLGAGTFSLDHFILPELKL